MGLGSFIKSVFGGAAAPAVIKVATGHTKNGRMPRGGYRIPKRVDNKDNNIICLKKNSDLFNTICLKKKIDPNITARVALVLDYSGSMSNMYDNGRVQTLVEKLLPVGIRFDDNEAIDIFVFSDGDRHEFTGEISPEEFDGYVDREIYAKFNFGGTEYSPVMKNIIDKYTSEEGEPAYVMFVTDGDCWDPSESLKTVKAAAKHGIFWQFIGIGNSSKGTLEELDDMKGRVVDNANFFDAKDINAMKEDDLYDVLMTEFPAWHKAALNKGIIKLD